MRNSLIQNITTNNSVILSNMNGKLILLNNNFTNNTSHALKLFPTNILDKKVPQIVYISNCHFINNQGTNDAIIQTKQNAIVYAINSTFVNNTSNGRGGVAFADIKQSQITFDNCSFINNKAFKGGVVYAHLQSKATFRNCFLIKNSAQLGGVAYVADDGIIESHNTTFEDNYAISGQFLYLQFINAQAGSLLRFRQTQFQNLQVNNIAMLSQSNLEIYDSMFFNISNQFEILNSKFNDIYGSNILGGAIFVSNTQGQTIYQVQIQNCSFQNNTAFEGGALYIDQAKINFKDSTFVSNKAFNSGGALFLKLKSENNTDLESSSIIQSSKFITNYAVSKGGAINYNLVRPKIFQDVVFSENYAKFGQNLAGEKYKLSFQTQEAITIANNILIKQEEIKIMILDKDNQVVEDDFETQITIQSKFYNASVVGEQIFTVQYGVGAPQISVVGAPGSKMILTIQSLTDQQILGDSKILNILPCQLGEVLQNGLSGGIQNCEKGYTGPICQQCTGLDKNDGKYFAKVGCQQRIQAEKRNIQFY
eukprot:403335615